MTLTGERGLSEARTDARGGPGCPSVVLSGCTVVTPGGHDRGRQDRKALRENRQPGGRTRAHHTPGPRGKQSHRPLLVSVLPTGLPGPPVTSYSRGPFLVSFLKPKAFSTHAGGCFSISDAFSSLFSWWWSLCLSGRRSALPARAGHPPAPRHRPLRPPAQTPAFRKGAEADGSTAGPRTTCRSRSLTTLTRGRRNLPLHIRQPVVRRALSRVVGLHVEDAENELGFAARRSPACRRRPWKDFGKHLCPSGYATPDVTVTAHGTGEHRYYVQVFPVTSESFCLPCLGWNQSLPL